jgi:hypothetical protein
VAISAQAARASGVSLAIDRRSKWSAPVLVSRTVSERRELRRPSSRAFAVGAPRIQGELLKLGVDISRTTVGRYLPRHAKPLPDLAHLFVAPPD